MTVDEAIDRMDAAGVWSDFDRSVAGEIVRQWLALGDVRGVREGLLAPRLRTPPPEASRDPFTGEAVDYSADVWGAGSYGEAAGFPVSPAKLGADDEDVVFPRGLQGAVVIQAVALMAPAVRAGDIWRDAGTGLVYKIKPVSHMAMVKGVPLVAGLVMFELPSDRPENDLAIWEPTSP